MNGSGDEATPKLHARLPAPRSAARNGRQTSGMRTVRQKQKAAGAATGPKSLRRCDDADRRRAAFIVAAVGHADPADDAVDLGSRLRRRGVHRSQTGERLGREATSPIDSGPFHNGPARAGLSVR